MKTTVQSCLGIFALVLAAGWWGLVGPAVAGAQQATSAAALAATQPAGVSQVVVGMVRVQLLSPTLVRLEQRGPRGFEDRPTFLVVQRGWPAMPYVRLDEGGLATVKTDGYDVVIPGGASGLEGTEVRGPDGKLLYKVPANPPAKPRFPAPGQLGGVFVVADHPRVVPPAWGATPAPVGADLGNLAASLRLGPAQ